MPYGDCGAGDLIAWICLCDFLHDQGSDLFRNPSSSEKSYEDRRACYSQSRGQGPCAGQLGFASPFGDLEQPALRVLDIVIRSATNQPLGVKQGLHW